MTSKVDFLKFRFCSVAHLRKICLVNSLKKLVFLILFINCHPYLHDKLRRNGGWFGWGISFSINADFILSLLFLIDFLALLSPALY